MSSHTIHRHKTHLSWSRSHEPAAVLSSGDVVTMQTIDASGGQLDANSIADDLKSYDVAKVNPVTGPLHVNGAEPGDVVSVEILDMQSVAGWGWTANIPGFGLLNQAFTEPALHHWRYKPKSSRPLMFGTCAAIPFQPIVGTIGTAPPGEAELPMIPPTQCGGNMDLPEIGVGATVFLPVNVAGCLLSLGDTHAAQGRGEVCGTGVESAFDVSIRVRLHKQSKLPTPRVSLPQRSQRKRSTTMTVGVAESPFEACRDALSKMIDYLSARHGLSDVEAYMLCSVASDMVVGELVNLPNFTMCCAIDERIFD